MSYKEIGKIFGKLAINFFEVCKPKLAQWQLQLLQKSMQVSWYRIAPPEKSLPADNLPAKIRPAAPGGRRGGKDFTGKLSAGETFLGAIL